MMLNQVRKLAIKSQITVQFPLPGGLECVIDQHGLAKIPGLKAAPNFNLEEEFAQATQFVVGTQPTTRAQLEFMTSAAGAGGAQPVEHEE
jgi:hypothetical protein